MAMAENENDKSDIDAVLEDARKKLQRASDARRRWDARWLSAALFMRGYHFARYNRSTNTVVFSTRSGAKIPINLAYAQKRSVKNQVVAFRPKWEVQLNDASAIGIWNAKMSGELLDSLFRTGQIRRKIRGVVDHGLDYSIGIWKVIWNDKLEDGEGDVEITLLDPFDVYWDPRATCFEDAEYITFSTAKPLSVIKSNPIYKNTDEVREDNKISYSNYKQFRERTTNKSGVQHKGTAILNETWIKERDDDGEVKMRVVTWTDNVKLRDEITDEEDFPFMLYRAHGDELSVCSESWASQVIPANQVLDALESHIFEYNHMMARGRFIIDNNAGASIVTNENGTFIQKNRGFECRQLEMHPLPSTVIEQDRNMIRYIQDIGGAHDISLGRLPTGIRSGLGIAELKQLDSTNQNLLVENLESFLQAVGKRVLKIYSKKLTTPRLFKRVGGPAYSYFVAKGETGRGGTETGDSYKMGDTELPLAIIGDPKHVKVSIGSWLAYTKDAQKEELKSWYEAGLIDQETFLRRVEFGDIEGVLERTRTEREEGRGSLQPGQAPGASAKGMKGMVAGSPGPPMAEPAPVPAGPAPMGGI